MGKISVIIPVFNAEKTLRQSVSSLLSQNAPCEVEVCIVDDCSTDHSVGIVEELAASALPEGLSIKIVRHRENRGVAAARNTGLDAASGDYVCYLDADDRMAPGALKRAVDFILENDADIVGWDWLLEEEGGSRYMRQAECPSPLDALKALMAGVLRWNLWLFMVKRELYDGFRFIPGMNVGEDMMMMTALLTRCRKFEQIHEPLYLYRQSDASISRKHNDITLSQADANIRMAEKILIDGGLGGLANPYLDFLKLNVKLPLLVSLDKDDYLRWVKWFPESSRSIMKNRMLPYRTRMLQFLASRHIWSMVRMYNRIVYGVIYKKLMSR